MNTEQVPLVVPNPSDGAPPPPPTRPRALTVQYSPRRQPTASGYGTLKSLRSKLGGSIRSFQQSGKFQQSSKFQESAYFDMQTESPMSERTAELGDQPTKLSCKVLFARYFFTALIFLLVLVSTALSKVCFVSIAAQLNANSSVGSGAEGKRRSVAFVQLVLILCVPQAVTILKTLFLGILGKTTKHFPWPTWPALLKVGFLRLSVHAHADA